MPRFQVAHVREKAGELVLVPLATAFREETPRDQQRFIKDLRFRAATSGMKGTVVPVWSGQRGRMLYDAPVIWHDLLNNLTIELVWANVNKEIAW